LLLALRDSHERLTVLAQQLNRGTGAERNASHVIEAALERAACDFECSDGAEEVADSTVCAVDDVHDYLLSHGLVSPLRLPAHRQSVLLRRGRRVSRRSVASWEKAQHGADGQSTVIRLRIPSTAPLDSGIRMA
jgi:hypothetical protein